MAPVMNCLPGKYKYLSSGSQHPPKKSGHGGTYLYSKSWRSRKGELRTHWPASLVTLVNFMFSERPCLENQVREWLEETLDLDLCSHMNAHMCADTHSCMQAHMNIHHTHGKKDMCSSIRFTIYNEHINSLTVEIYFQQHLSYGVSLKVPSKSIQSHFPTMWDFSAVWLGMCYVSSASRTERVLKKSLV